jgi:hypothetical protein
MKEQLNVRVTPKRLAKLKAIALEREKTVTALVEDWIDRLPVPEKCDTVELYSPEPRQ